MPIVLWRLAEAVVAAVTCPSVTISQVVVRHLNSCLFVGDSDRKQALWPDLVQVDYRGTGRCFKSLNSQKSSQTSVHVGDPVHVLSPSTRKSPCKPRYT